MSVTCSSCSCLLLLLLLFLCCCCCFHEEAYATRNLLDTDEDATINMTMIDATMSDYQAWLAYVASRSTFSVSAAAAAGDGDGDYGDGAVISVSKSGGADFSSVQDAVDSIPDHNQQRVTIQIAAGTYKEKVTIPSSKPYITFQGEGSGITTITWDDTASSSGSTFKSASVAVNSNNFIARDIAFKNSAPAPPPGAVGRQAVALRISGDQAAFYNCKFYGAQDTLYDQKGRHYFKNCFIQGSIDFIFGDGQSYYTDCELNSIATSSGSLTAQKREKPSEDTGFSFVNCKVSGSGTIYLGRAWGAYSRVVFLYTYIDNIIKPGGWDDFGDSSHQRTSFYGEYQCSGPGANAKNRVTWSYQLTASQAAPFESISYIDGESWISS